MKRALLKAVRVITYEPGAVVDRSGFLSAIFAAGITAADADVTMDVVIKHCDTEGGTFEPITDPMIALGNQLTGIPVVTDQLINMDLDLLECKRFVTVTPAFKGGNGEGAFALALGDADRQPV